MLVAQSNISRALPVACALLAAWGAPALLDLLDLDPLSGFIAYRNSVIAALIATSVALIGQSRLSAFPGVSAIASVFPAFAFAFGMTVAVFLATRLPYSNVFLGVSFAASLLTAFYFEIVRARHRQELHAVPGGEVGRLAKIENVNIKMFKKPVLPKRHNITIVADLHHDHAPEWEGMLARAALEGIPVYHYKTVLQSLTGKVQIDHLSENIYGSLMPNLGYLGVKRLFDTLLVILVAPIIIPLFAVVALLVRIDSPGPAIFAQKRVGYRGETFTVYKFRTMRVSPPPADETARSASMTRDNDERITRLGQFLRRTRIDELPQVINILRGEMSWIGPRPEAVDLAEWYEREVPFYAYRHVVRPGITGWAQVNQGHVTEVREIQEKLEYDFFYIANFSYWVDALIIARSLLVVLNGFGAR
jgi:lipopolysaccharide/colanic/teichoic acid biosynthesis glycosyltransferase